MTTSMFSSDLVRRLRRSVLLSGVLFLSLTAAICGDDDDDDDGTGPSADCIDAFSSLLAENDVDEDDVQGIEVGGSESGSLSSSDVQDSEGYYADIYVVEVDNAGQVDVTLNPSGFDAVLIAFDESMTAPIFSDDPDDPDATEQISADVEEGCYLIVVTSYEPNETGSYTLSID